LPAARRLIQRGTIVKFSFKFNFQFSFKFGFHDRAALTPSHRKNFRDSFV
jgi:hypothetical protein